MEERLSVDDFESIKGRRIAEDPRYATIAERLRQLFWNSECNDVTLRFYLRLQNEAIIHGEPVRQHIKAVAATAKTARNPVRYFAASVTRRLREQGYLQTGEEDLW